MILSRILKLQSLQSDQLLKALHLVHLLFFKVTLPVCLPAILDIATYLFVNALTTTSAVVFLYSTDTIPASVSILNMDDAGQTGAAAAMAVMIMMAAAIAKIVQMTLGKLLENRTQAWRKR